MRIDLEKYVLEVDVEKTMTFHNGKNSEGCTCSGCRNFKKAMERVDRKIVSFFHFLGLEPESVDSLTPLAIDRDNIMGYVGEYHLCGEIIGGSNWPRRTLDENNAWHKTPGNNLFNDPEVIYLSKKFRVTFSDDPMDVDRDFPKPAIALEISVELPWVLDLLEAEEYRYE